MVYDIKRKDSFESIKNYWYEQLKASGEDNMVLAIAGNKCDLFIEEKVPEAEAKNFAKEIGAVFRLTSCKDSIGIDDLFKECGEKYLKENKLISISENNKKNNFTLNNEKEKDKKEKKDKKDRCC